jgi:hypothetical protein
MQENLISEISEGDFEGMPRREQTQTVVITNTMRDFRPRNTLCTLTTTLHVSTLLGSSSGVLFFHYIRHCNEMFTLCPCVVVPVVGLANIRNRMQKTTIKVVIITHMHLFHQSMDRTLERPLFLF